MSVERIQVGLEPPKQQPREKAHIGTKETSFGNKRSPTERIEVNRTAPPPLNAGTTEPIKRGPHQTPNRAQLKSGLQDPTGTINHSYEGKTHIPSDSRPLGPGTKNNRPKKIPKSQASYKPTSIAFRLLKHSATILKKGLSFVKTALTVVNDVLDLTKQGLDTITSLMKSITPNTQNLPKEGKRSHEKQ